MIRCFCDACNKEIEEPPRRLQVLCHIEDMVRKHTVHLYVNNNGDAISGRTEEYELCATCYNKIMGAAMVKMVEIEQGVKGVSDGK